MRPKERIPIFFNLIDWSYLSKRWKLPKDIDKHVLNHVPYINVSKYWLEHPDQRIGQVLINLGLLADNMRIWLDEETDILKDQGLDPREFLLWGSIYNKDGNLRDETEYNLIKDLDTEHIEKILKMFENSRSKLLPLYEETFNKELKLRNEETSDTQEKSNTV